MPDVCGEHSRYVQEIGELKGLMEAQKARDVRIEKMLSDIYEKLNSSNVNTAEFKGRIFGGIAVFMAVAMIAGIVGGFIKGAIEHAIK